MRMSCGRSDGEPTKRAREIPWSQACSHRIFYQSNYYNRLEYWRSFRLIRAAMRSILSLHAALTQPSGQVAPGTHIQEAKPQAFLSLVQGRKSCPKQIWRVTPFRKGIA